MHRTVYDTKSRMFGEADPATILSGCNLVNALRRKGLFAEARPLARKHHHAAQALTDHHPQRHVAAGRLAEILSNDPAASRADLLEAEALIVDSLKRKQRVLGPRHPDTLRGADALRGIREILSGK